MGVIFTLSPGSPFGPGLPCLPGTPSLPWIHTNKGKGISSAVWDDQLWLSEKDLRPVLGDQVSLRVLVLQGNLQSHTQTPLIITKCWHRLENIHESCQTLGFCVPIESIPGSVFPVRLVSLHCLHRLRLICFKTVDVKRSAASRCSIC